MRGCLDLNATEKLAERKAYVLCKVLRNEQDEEARADHPQEEAKDEDDQGERPYFWHDGLDFLIRLSQTVLSIMLGSVEAALPPARGPAPRPRPAQARHHGPPRPRGPTPGAPSRRAPTAPADCTEGALSRVETRSASRPRRRCPEAPAERLLLLPSPSAFPSLCFRVL